MPDHLTYILDKIEELNAAHALKLRRNIDDLDNGYAEMANRFFHAYNHYVNTTGKTIDFGIECYMRMLNDMHAERIKFIQSGKYSNTSFEEVAKSIYGNDEVMAYHMHGLVLAQFLWFEQYERIKFFCGRLPHFASGCSTYLEIGGGHGLYTFEALRLLKHTEKFVLVDISQSSLNLAKGIINNDNTEFLLKNIFDFDNDAVYDFITMGEVLEHVEDPLSLLKKVAALLGNTGTAYITTPVNAPMIDHIYLFSNTREIREMISAAGLEITEEKTVISERTSEKKAEAFKIPVMFSAFVKNKN